LAKHAKEKHVAYLTFPIDRSITPYFTSPSQKSKQLLLLSPEEDPKVPSRYRIRTFACVCLKPPA